MHRFFTVGFVTSKPPPYTVHGSTVNFTSCNRRAAEKHRFSGSRIADIQGMLLFVSCLNIRLETLFSTVITRL